MNIEDKEEKLFNEWRRKPSIPSFVFDGCPRPDIYSSVSRKIIFVLKDGNMGESSPGDEYDLRVELKNSPKPWWSTIAKWCYFLDQPDASWGDSRGICDQSSIKSALSRHCFVQLKKTYGGGLVSNDDLEKFVKNNTEEIISQLSIYAPHFIVACGNADQFRTIFGCTNENRKQTKNGIGYWPIQLNKNDCYLVDYCHPSIRVGTKVKGLIAKGLSSAISEIENVPHAYSMSKDLPE